MKKFVILRSDGKYYKHTKSGGGRFVDTMAKAKAYSQIGHAKNAAIWIKRDLRWNKFGYTIVTCEMKETGDFFPI